MQKGKAYPESKLGLSMSALYYSFGFDMTMLNIVSYGLLTEHNES